MSINPKFFPDYSQLPPEPVLSLDPVECVTAVYVNGVRMSMDELRAKAVDGILQSVMGPPRGLRAWRDHKRPA